MPDLVAQRRVLLVGGHAAVSARDLSSLVVQDFRASVSKVWHRGSGFGFTVGIRVWDFGFTVGQAHGECHIF